MGYFHERVEVKCLTCGNIFKPFYADVKRGKAKYCSRNCVPRSKKESRICKICGKEFLVRLSRLGRYKGECCSAECGYKLKSQRYVGRWAADKHFNWKGGSSFAPYPLGWTDTFREQIRYRDKYTCQLCGKPEVECNRKLQVHHIDYNKENLDQKNLISLCISCHMKTNYHREEWIKLFGGIYAEASTC